MFEFLAPIIIKFLGNEALSALFSFITTELNNRNLTIQGMQQEAAKETAATAKTEHSIAQSLSDAPHSLTETEKALDSGKF